jgi:hypothetical protein
MTVTAPLTDPAAEAEALFREARLRTRRRRRRRAAAGGVALALATVAYAVVSAGDVTPARSASAGPIVDRAAFAGHGRLAFVSEGRLYLLDATALTAVSRPGQSVSNPQFSPDGRFLTYAARSGTEYLAHADGTGARPVGPAFGTQTWLPDGDLIAGRTIWRVGATGLLTRVAAVPRGLVAWSPDGGRYVFFDGTARKLSGGRVDGTGTLDVAASLAGPRATWYTTHTSFTPRNGVQGNELDDALVLPDNRGILFRLDPGGSSSVAEDGLTVYLLRAPGNKPITLASTVAFSVSLGAGGSFALTNGLDRYATLTKNVEVCSAAAGRCASVPARHGQISFDPAFSPGGATLAYVQAPPTSQEDFEQRHVVAWYATHTLWTLAPGGAPREIPGATGASTPTWSADGRTILYTAHDALWIVGANGRGTPVRIAGPLFDPLRWPASWFQVDWQDQFAWSS